jgi:aspartate carbamoyltransferase regulatory subunit
MKCIYKSNEKIDKSKILNEYTHILEDPTLPVIYNKNIKCPNVECETNKKNSIPEVKYIKYDTENIYFMYMCNTCNQKWTNDENNI